MVPGIAEVIAQTLIPARALQLVEIVRMDQNAVIQAQALKPVLMVSGGQPQHVINLKMVVLPVAVLVFVAYLAIPIIVLLEIVVTVVRRMSLIVVYAVVTAILSLVYPQLHV